MALDPAARELALRAIQALDARIAAFTAQFDRAAAAQAAGEAVDPRLIDWLKLRRAVAEAGKRKVEESVEWGVELPVDSIIGLVDASKAFALDAFPEAIWVIERIPV